MVKDHSDSEEGNPLPPHRLLLGFFYMHHPTDRITHTTAFVTPVVEHWLEREIAQWVHPMKDRSDWITEFLDEGDGTADTYDEENDDTLTL